MLFALHQQPPSSCDLTGFSYQIALLLLHVPKCCFEAHQAKCAKPPGAGPLGGRSPACDADLGDAGPPARLAASPPPPPGWTLHLQPRHPRHTLQCAVPALWSLGRRWSTFSAAQRCSGFDAVEQVWATDRT